MKSERRLGWLLLIFLVCFCGCEGKRLERRGAIQQQVVSRTYPLAASILRQKILEQFGQIRGGASGSFHSMHVVELKPPAYRPDWFDTTVDTGRFLDVYKRFPEHQRSEDLLLDEGTGDSYWQSEYVTPDGPVRFRCAFIIHLGAQAEGTTRVEVYERSPTVWVGERWSLLHHGLVGKVHDIRFVDPTVKDRLDLLDAIGEAIR